MAVTASNIAGAIIAAGPPDVTGVSFPSFANVIGNAVSSWVKTDVFLAGVTTGTDGSGTVLGTLTVPPNVSVVQSTLQSNGIVGAIVPQISRVLAVGLSNSLTATAEYTGPSIGVGVGADSSFVVTANPLPLASLLISLGFDGASGFISSIGLASSISSLLLLGTGSGVVSGATAGNPATGSSPNSSVF